MTSRELLALAVVAAPRRSRRCRGRAAAPRFVARRARCGASVSARLALALAAVALVEPGTTPSIGDWLVVDAAGGLLVGVIGAVGPRQRARLARLPRRRLDRVVRSRGARARVLRRSSSRSGRCSLAVPLAGNLGAAWLLVEATTAVSALLVGFSGKPRALEAGWKYLILTSLGLGVALLGIVLLAAGVAARRPRRLSPGASSAASARGPATRALVAYLLLLAGTRGEDRLGARPQLAARRALRGAARRSRRCSRRRCCRRCCSSPGGPSQALAPAARRRDGADRARRVRARLARGRGAVPLARRSPWKRLLAYSSLEHMGVLALGIGFAYAARARRRRDPRRRARAREGARLLRGDAAARARAARGRARRCAASARTQPRLGAALGHLARHARRRCRRRRSSRARC